MNELSVFELGIGVVVVPLNGLIAKAVAGIWLSDDKARIAAFAFMLGSMGALPKERSGLVVGAVIGLVGLWWLFFKRGKAVA